VRGWGPNRPVAAAKERNPFILENIKLGAVHGPKGGAKGDEGSSDQEKNALAIGGNVEITRDVAKTR